MPIQFVAVSLPCVCWCLNADASNVGAWYGCLQTVWTPTFTHACGGVPHQLGTLDMMVNAVPIACCSPHPCCLPSPAAPLTSPAPLALPAIPLNLPADPRPCLLASSVDCLQPRLPRLIWFSPALPIQSLSEFAFALTQRCLGNEHCRCETGKKQRNKTSGGRCEGGKCRPQSN